MSMISLERVGFNFGQQSVISNLTLEVEEGASLGLIGPNGCGKSTVLKLVATLFRPDEGRVLVGGIDTRLDARNVRRRIGYVPDQLGVYPGLTVWQYLTFFARCGALPALERKTTVETMLRVVDLYDHRQVETQQLSRGMLRRLALARALLNNPLVLLLDDPLGGLDGRGRLELLEVLKELRGMGITVILSGHLLGDIVQLCSHVAILREGRLIRAAAVDDLLREQAPASRRIEVEVLFGEEVARGVLRTFPEAREVSAHDNTVSFAYYGDWAGLATLLGRLVQEGVQVTRFGPGPEGYDELAAGLVASPGRVAR